MGHETALIETIAIGLAAAFLGGMIARRLRMPAMTGYLLAGVAVGPFTPGLVADTDTAAELAELGVILLMFGVGIHFSIPDLLAVRGIAVPGALVQSTAATLVGIALGVALGWGIAGGLVLGLAVSVASTVVLLRAIGDRGELDTVQGRIAIGWLIVEDLFTVIVLVLLPSLTPILSGDTAAGLGGPLVEVGVAIGKAAIFAALMLVLGTRVVPAVLDAVARERSRELFTLAVLAVAIGIGWVASAVFGVSFALGAFLAGAVLSGTDTSHQAAADALPLRDAFSVLFFVSVGMLLDPAYLLQEPLAILAVLGLILVVKSVAAFGIVAVFRYPARVGLTVAAALAQVGEFSFIVASLGLSLGLVPDEAFQLVVAGALISITLNPLVFRSVEPVERWLRKHPRVLQAVERSPRELTMLDEGEPERLHGHAILCGYGRVGRLVASALERRGFRFVVVSDDRSETERLRDRGVPALYGSAASPGLLEEAGLDGARVVIVAVPEPHTARLIVDRVRAAAPRVPLVVRTHSGPEASHLRALGPSVQPVYAEREVAIQLTRFSLRRFGLSTVEVDAIASGLRQHDPSDPGSGGGTTGPGMAERARGRLEALGRRVRATAGRRAAASDDAAEDATAAPEPSGSAPPAAT